MTDTSWLDSQQTQVVRLEHLLASYRAQLADSQAQGWRDIALLTRLILAVRDALEVRHRLPLAPSNQPRPSAEMGTSGSGHQEQIVEYLMAYFRTHIERLHQRIAQLDAELTISQERGYADCEILTEQIKSLQEDLERLNHFGQSRG